MAASVEVKYFNTFVLKKTNNDEEPIWNGSFGIPQDMGGYPVLTGITGNNNWNIEESRIRGGYNNTTIDFGVKAYIVDESNTGSFRLSSLIYSGIFNSRTGINQTNVFSVGEDITKTADPANASIQKLYAEDTNLIIFQENKVSRALIDKDAIYSAEGGGTAVSSFTTVIGQIVPYLGEYGISKNPESFAVYGYNKYFSDKNNNSILKLSNNGISEISSYGMRDYFRHELNRIGNQGMVIGGYDIHNNQYLVSTQLRINSPQKTEGFKTVSYDEQPNGWVSFFSYTPEQMLSLKNKFYTVFQGGIYEHYSTSVNRGSFYSVETPSEVTVVFNAAADRSKTFKTVSYEGSNGWTLKSLFSDSTGVDYQPNVITISNIDEASSIKSYYEGEYIQTSSSALCSQTVTGTSVVVYSNIDIPIGSSINSDFITIPAATTVTNQVEIIGFASADSISNTVTLTGASYVVPVGTELSGPGITPGTIVTSYNSTTGVLVTSQNIQVNVGSTITFVGLRVVFVNNSTSFVLNAILNFSSVTDRNDYLSVFGTEYPPYDKQRVGFCRKENKYVANIINNSAPAAGEIIFGDSMSGVKGYYTTATISTDQTTDKGGEKQLFKLSSNFIYNNGY
jgi:hypothetical protein